MSRVNDKREFKDFMSGIWIVDTAKHSELLGKTFGELGATSVPEKVRNTKLGDAFNQKLPDLITGKEVITPIGVAATIWDTGAIYVSSNIQNTNVGLKMFHEMLHASFKGDHIQILRDLKLTVPEINSKPNETMASRRLDEWLAGGCR